MQYVLSHQKEQVRFPGISVEIKGEAVLVILVYLLSLLYYLLWLCLSNNQSFHICAGETVAWILPFTSGGFLYIALVNVVPDLLEEKNPW